VVVRLCEVWGSRGPVRVTLHRPFVSVARTDLLERVVSRLASQDGAVEFELRPFELVTLAFELAIVDRSTTGTDRVDEVESGRTEQQSTGPAGNS